jgi:mRNA-degrading endonuclease RelE of RelBE toxin-antitoxin system
MNSSKNWHLEIRAKVLRTVARFPKKDRDRIIQVLEMLPNDPFTGDVEKMVGEINVWRRRVGAYRIFYELRATERIVYVYTVKRRTSKTY